MTPEEDRMGFTPEGWDELMKQSPVVNKDLSADHPQFRQHDPYTAQSQQDGWIEIMNEYEAGHRFKGWADGYGEFTRLENSAGASIPDAIYSCQGYMGFFELKIRYGRFIYGPPFQMAYAVRVSHHLHDWQHHYAVYEPDLFKIYTVRQIRSCPSEVRGRKVRYDVSQLKPVFQVEDAGRFKDFLDYLMKKAFD